MGLQKWLEQIGEKAGDTALHATGQPTSAPEYEKMKAVKEEKARRSYSGKGDAQRMQDINKATK